jgi:hypothetical protein
MGEIEQEKLHTSYFRKTTDQIELYRWLLKLVKMCREGARSCWEVSACDAMQGTTKEDMIEVVEEG